MTEEDLAEIEARAARWAPCPKFTGDPPSISVQGQVNALLTVVQEDMPALLLEVRRLKQLAGEG